MAYELRYFYISFVPLQFSSSIENFGLTPSQKGEDNSIR